MNLLRNFGRRETQVGSMRLRQRMTETWIQLRLEARHSDLFRRANMQSRMQDASRVVRHQNLHLPLRQCFHVKILCPVFLVFAFRGCTGLFVPLVNEYTVLREAVTSPRNGFLR